MSRDVSIQIDGEQYVIPVDAELTTMAAPIVSHGTDLDASEAMSLPTSELYKLTEACLEDAVEDYHNS